MNDAPPTRKKNEVSICGRIDCLRIQWHFESGGKLQVWRQEKSRIEIIAVVEFGVSRR
jgi:hypothetical protein